MTTKTLTGTYASGYSLARPITTLSIAASGYVEGQGIATSAGARHAYHLDNDGRVAAAAYLEADGAYLAHGGVIINGGTTNQNALISGFDGVYLGAGHETVGNFGTIAGAYYDGVVLNGGGKVTNGGAVDTAARIEGYQVGVAIFGQTGAVTNFGTIADTTAVRDSRYNAGVVAAYGGDVVNGNPKDPAAMISGYQGVFMGGVQVSTVENFGTISAAGRFGVQISSGGVIVNGSATDQRAFIHGAVYSRYGTTTLTNFGRIVAATGSDGVYFRNGQLINGSAHDPHTLIEGTIGVGMANGVATLTNFGTIWGRGGEAVGFGGSNALFDRLIVEAGSVMVGYATGGGGTLELANGAGTITAYNGHFAPTGDGFTVSGSMRPARFQVFFTLDIGAAGRFVDNQLVSVDAGFKIDVEGSLDLVAASQSITNAGVIGTDGGGTCTIAGALVNGGALYVDGGALTVTGAAAGDGTAVISQGTLDLVSSATQNVTFNGSGGVLMLGASQEYAGTLTGFSQTGSDTLDLGDIAFVNAGEASFSGTATGGTLTVSDGTHTAYVTLAGDYLDATFVSFDDQHDGVAVVAMPAADPAAIHRFVAAAAAVAPGSASMATHDHTMAPLLLALARPVHTGQRLT